MIRLIFILLIGTIPSSAQTVMGREAVFTHIDPRRVKVDGIPNNILLTGKADGLMLQLPAKPKMQFPKNASTVLTPGGELINLELAPYSGKRLRGCWTATFAHPHVMLKGVYSYNITLNINGKEFKFVHSIDYFFKQIESNRGIEIQKD